MAIDKEIIDLLNEFGLNLTVDLKSNLRKKLDERAAKHQGRKVTSRLEASVLANKVKFSSGSLIFSLTMNDYWEVVDKGRKAAGVSKDGQKKIAEWSATRGFAEKLRISDLAARKEKQSKSKSKRKLKTLKKMPFENAKRAAAFLISRKLKSKKLEPTHFFEQVVQDGRLDELKSKIAEIIKTDFIINIQ